MGRGGGKEVDEWDGVGYCGLCIGKEGVYGGGVLGFDDEGWVGDWEGGREGGRREVGWGVDGGVVLYVGGVFEGELF